MDGWIKLHRKIRENPVFNDMELMRLWIICLTEATHKGRDQLIGKQIVQLLPGEFVTGRFDLHAHFNKGLKPKDRVTEYTVWRWLLTLQELDFVSIKSSNKFSIVSVVKWANYQSCEQENEQQMSNKRATDEQQMSTNKNEKNKELKHIVDSDECDLQFNEFWKAYPKRDGKAPALKKWTSYYKAKQLDFEEVMNGLNRYIAFVTHERTVRKFDRPWLSGSTFVNQRQWESEWKIESRVIPLKPITKEIEISPESEEVLAKAYGRASST